MDNKEILEALWVRLDAVLGTAQMFEEESEGDERFVKLREMVEEVLDYYKLSIF